MPRFAANLSMLFADLPWADRFAAAAHAGFRAVEVQFPYELPAATLRSLLDAHGLQMVLHNLPAGDWAGGERGIACLPDRVVEFRQGVQTALAYANTLGVRQLNVIAGICPKGVSEADAQRTLVDNLRYAATELAAAFPRRGEASRFGTRKGRQETGMSGHGNRAGDRARSRTS